MSAPEFRLSFRSSLFLLPFLFLSLLIEAQICDPDGHLVIYSNYDGGLLNINVDEDVSPLYIGVASYEFSRIVISGDYASNVAAVWYAGYDADNDHCDLGNPLYTTITGVDASITQIEFLPDAPLTGGDLPTYIIYNYQCDSEPSSGNSPEQLVSYFAQMGSANLRLHATQYGCWSATQYISDGGNCCLSTEADIPGCTDPSACNYNPAATVDDGSCIAGNNNGGCTDIGACNYNMSALTDDGSCHYLCFGCFDALACNYDPDATIDDESCDYSCLGCTYPNASNYDADATRDDGSCDFSCEQDFDNNGLVNTQDLLMFLQVFGTICD